MLVLTNKVRRVGHPASTVGSTTATSTTSAAQMAVARGGGVDGRLDGHGHHLEMARDAEGRDAQIVLALQHMMRTRIYRSHDLRHCVLLVPCPKELEDRVCI